MLLKTERLILREFTLDDAPFIINLVNSEGWLKYIGDRHVKTLADAARYLTEGPFKSYRENGFGLSAVQLIESGELVGMCGLINREGLEHIDLGFAFLPQHQGKGYGFEIADACLHDAFHRLNLEKVLAITMPENQGSIALLEKLGMHWIDTIELADDPEKLRLYATPDRGFVKPPFFDFPTLTGDQVQLREIRLDEAAQVREILSYDQRTAQTDSEAEKILRKVDHNYRCGDAINWGIYERSTGELVGTIGYYRGFKNDTGEIGFVVKEKFRRRGYARMAVSLLVPFGFNTMRLKRVVAFTRPDNDASQKLLQVCRFTKTGQMQGDYIEFEYLI